MPSITTRSRSISPIGCSICCRWRWKTLVQQSCASRPIAPYGWKSAGSRAIWGTSGSLGLPHGSPPIRSHSRPPDPRAGVRVTGAMVVQSEANEKLILAVPKGRILSEAAPLLVAADIQPEKAFADPDSRQLRFATNHPDLDIIPV